MADHKHIFDEHGSIIKLDPIVHKDELDKELMKMEDRINQNIDKKFAELNQKLDKRFDQIDKQINHSFGFLALMIALLGIFITVSHF